MSTGNEMTFRVIVKILKFLFLIIFLGILLGVIYTFSLINDLNKSGTFSLKKETFEKEIHHSIVFETDSYLNIKDLNFLELFSSIKETNKWVEDNVYFSNLTEISKTQFKVLNPLSFEIEKVNHCELVNCLQRRIHFSNLPSVLWRGLIGIEDFRFLDHQGIDPISILRAIIVDIKAGSFVQGGSTLTQQLVKNLFLTNSKSITRKIKEAIMAIYIESKYSKEEILQAYFNEVSWGSLAGISIKGVMAASKLYFSKDPSQLSSFEAIILSSMLKGPYSYHPLKNLEKLKKRTISLYKNLVSKKMISKLDESLWEEEDWYKWEEIIKNKNKDTKFKAYAFASKEEDFINNFITHDESLKFIKNNNEDISVKYYENSFRCDQRYCDLNYFSKLELDSIEFLKKKKQVGSILKPIFYQIMLNNGVASFEEISTAPVEIVLPSGSWVPRDRKFYSDFISLDRALKESRNIPIVRKVRDFGFDKVEKEFEKYTKDFKRPLREYPSQILGSLELGFPEIFEIYRNFKNQECLNDRRVYFILNNPIENTLKNSVNSELSRLEFFGKTGTTNNSLDNWFITIDDEKMKVIWVGIDGDRTDKKLNLSGSGSAFKLFQSIHMRNGKKLRPLECLNSGQRDEFLDIN